MNGLAIDLSANREFEAVVQTSTATSRVNNPAGEACRSLGRKALPPLRPGFFNPRSALKAVAISGRTDGFALECVAAVAAAGLSSLGGDCLSLLLLVTAGNVGQAVPLAYGAVACHSPR